MYNITITILLQTLIAVIWYKLGYVKGYSYGSMQTKAEMELNYMLKKFEETALKLKDMLEEGIERKPMTPDQVAAETLKNGFETIYTKGVKKTHKK